MAVQIQHLTPLKKGGQVTKHHGKGSQMASMPNRGSLAKLGRNPSINNYAKATPMPSGQVDPTGGSAGGGYGLGSGSFAGNGM
jgi:hypothetical protein